MTEVEIIEVGPRDGLQIETRALDVSEKVGLIQRLRESGLQWIEVGSFVSPKAVPQMANTDDVIAALGSDPYWMTLVPNLKGFEMALSSKIQKIALFTAASDSFAQHNINCTIAESLTRFSPVLERAKSHGIYVRGYVSCIAGCPYEGEVPVQRVVDVCKKLYQMGCDEISLGDTIGVGTPRQIIDIIKAVSGEAPLVQLALHCHDTYGQALANIYAALCCGVRRFDAAVAGLGGCPYAPGASGNVATEDVVYMLDGMNVTTNVNLSKLIQTAHWLHNELNLPLRSKVSLAAQRK